MDVKKSLLFIPDISGFTHFVQTTERQHSEHVIAELLEVLIAANTQRMKLAEVEGDALFFYKECQIPSQEKLLAQVETMYTAFYSHLKMMGTNRICPCKACATATELELKIVLHCSDLQFITVQDNRKPFGEGVIQAHRLLKNSINNDNYVLLSRELADEVGIKKEYESKLFSFRESVDTYDDKEIHYIYSKIDVSNLKLNNFEPPEVVITKRPPDFTLERTFDIDPYELFELITNYRHRHLWVDGVEEFKYNEHEVTRSGTEHVCVINGKHFNFTTVTKDVPVHKLIYGELTTDPPPVDKLYQFYIIEAVHNNKTKLVVEQYWTTRTLLQKVLMATIGKRQISKTLGGAIDNLERLVHSPTQISDSLSPY